MGRVSLAVFAAAQLIACGASNTHGGVPPPLTDAGSNTLADGGSDGGSNTPGRESACKSNVSTYCDKLFQCDPTGVGAYGQFASAADCISSLSPMHRREQLRVPQRDELRHLDRARRALCHRKS